MNEQQLNALFEIVRNVVESRGSINIHLAQYDKKFNPVTLEVAKSKVEYLATSLGAEVINDTEETEKSAGVHDFNFETEGACRIRVVHSYITDKEITKKEGKELSL